MLVDFLAEDSFRWKLLQALAVAASDPEVQQKAEATATFFREQGEVPVADPAAGPDLNSGSGPATGSGSPAGGGGAAPHQRGRAYRAMKVDLFYCGEAAGRGATLADAALALRVQASVRWRVRALPEEINSRPGYDIHRHLLRFNRDERPAALAPQADLKTLLKVDVAVMEIQYPTPNYLSVFFCG